MPETGAVIPVPCGEESSASWLHFFLFFGSGWRKKTNSNLIRCRFILQQFACRCWIILEISSNVSRCGIRLSVVIMVNAPFWVNHVSSGGMMPTKSSIDELGPFTDFINVNKTTTCESVWSVWSCVVYSTGTLTNNIDSYLLFLGTCDNIAVLQAHAQAVTSVSRDMISLLGNRHFVMLYVLKYWSNKNFPGNTKFSKKV